MGNYFFTAFTAYKWQVKGYLTFLEIIFLNNQMTVLEKNEFYILYIVIRNILTALF